MNTNKILLRSAVKKQIPEKGGTPSILRIAFLMQEKLFRAEIEYFNKEGKEKIATSDEWAEAPEAYISVFTDRFVKMIPKNSISDLVKLEINFNTDQVKGYILFTQENGIKSQQDIATTL